MNQNIADIINEWDPIDLFPMAPRDEYVKEIERIKCIISNKSSISTNELAMEIHNLFTARFGNDVFLKELSDCYNIAKLILQNNNSPEI